MNIAKLFLVVIVSRVPLLSRCFMMLLPSMPVIGEKTQPKTDQDVRTAVNQLMQESADKLVLNRGQYGHMFQEKYWSKNKIDQRPEIEIKESRL
jgi:hypothetical protein